jgi:hypothetical protein
MTQPQPREDWQRLRRELADRIDHLGLQQSDIQTAGGPSPAKQREILNGRSQTLTTSLRRGFEHALDWPPGTIDVILAGGKPPQQSPQGTPISRMTASELVTSLEDLAREFRRRVSNDPESWPPDWVPSQG